MRGTHIGRPGYKTKYMRTRSPAPLPALATEDRYEKTYVPNPNLLPGHGRRRGHLLGSYLRFFEKSWFEHLLGLGISLPDWERAGTFLMVKEARLDLKEKVHYGDEIEVRTSVVGMKNAQFSMHHQVFKEGRVVDGRRDADGMRRWVGKVKAHTA